MKRVKLMFFFSGIHIWDVVLVHMYSRTFLSLHECIGFLVNIHEFMLLATGLPS